MEQRWCPTSVQVTALQARGLRIKGKSGTNDAYAVLQVGKEKYQTSVAEKCVAPVWKEEAAFDLPPPSQRGELLVQVMHRALVGPDRLLGQAAIGLLQPGEDDSGSRTEWFKLLDKTGKADKDRGEVLLDIQFMRNNLTASMFDLSAAGKSRSRLSKFKDKVRGKKKESDTLSGVVPSFTQVLTDSEEEHGEVAAEKDEKKKKHKMKSLFSPKSNLQRNMSQSMTVLPASSSLSGSQSPGLNVEASEGKKKFKFIMHKRSGSSDNKEPCSGLQKHSTVEQSNLCINGSHVYCEEPQTRTSRIGSNFSLTSSSHGSMEDVPERQYSPCTEEDEDMANVDNIEENVAEEERMRMEEESMKKGEVEERLRRQEEIEKLAEENRGQEEEKNRREEERKRREKDEIIRREEEECKQLEAQRKLEEQERRRTEEAKKQREEEEQIKMEEKRVWEEKRRQEEERLRREEEQKLEEKRRLEEEERRVIEEKVKKEEEERKRREEEKAEEERRRLEEEERVRKEQERRLKEEERCKIEREEYQRLVEERLKLEEENKRIEAEQKIKREEEQKVRIEEERRMKEEVERIRRENEKQEEERRLEEEERRRIEEEEKRQREKQERIREEEVRRQEEEERAKKEREYERLAEERRKQEEYERIQKEEEERIRKEAEERIIMEEKRRKEEKERVRKELEEMKRLAGEKRRQEEHERKRKEERIRKEEEERIRIEEERRRQEEEERVRKEREEIKRLAEEKRRLEEQENMKIEKEGKDGLKETKPERKRKEDESRKLEKEELVRQAEEQKTEQKSKDGLKSKVSMGSPTEVTSSNPFDDSYSTFEENPNSSVGPDRSTAKVPSIHQRCQSAVASVEIKSIYNDEKDLISVQSEKRPAPQPPGSNQAERLCQRDTDVATRHLAQANKQSKDKDIKTASVLPQRSVHLIAPVSRSPIDTKSTQSSMQSSGTKGATSAAIQSKRPAPRPPSVDEEPSSRPKTTSPSVGDISAGGSEAKQHHVVYGFNPFEEDDEEQEDLAPSGETRSIHWPPAVSRTGSQTKMKSSKVAHAPPPPAGITTGSPSGTQACDPESEAKTSVQAQRSPAQETRAVAQITEEEAGVKKQVPPTASRRLQPVKPLNPLEQQSVSVIQGENDSKSTGILSSFQDKMKVNNAGLKGPYSQLTRDELISLVLKQEKQLSEKSNKISELEKYIDNLLVRVMEEKPSILMSLSSMKKAA